MSDEILHQTLQRSLCFCVSLNLTQERTTGAALYLLLINHLNSTTMTIIIPMFKKTIVISGTRFSILLLFNQIKKKLIIYDYEHP